MSMTLKSETEYRALDGCKKSGRYITTTIVVIYELSKR